MTAEYCLCDGRYAGCQHGSRGRCPSKPGTPWSRYFCPDCDERRRTHITAQLTKLTTREG